MHRRGSGSEDVVQAHDLDRALVAPIEVAAPVDGSGVPESALFHDSPGGGIVHEEIAPEGFEAQLVEAVVDHRPQGFGAQAPVPVGFCNPVAQFRIVFADGDVALAIGVEAHAADGLAALLQLQGPGVVVGEELPDDVQAVLDGLVRRPAGPGADVGIGGVLEERLRIRFRPGAEPESD